jgi:hypothetical protein
LIIGYVSCIFGMSNNFKFYLEHCEKRMGSSMKRWAFELTHRLSWAGARLSSPTVNTTPTHIKDGALGSWWCLSEMGMGHSFASFWLTFGFNFSRAQESKHSENVQDIVNSLYLPKTYLPCSFLSNLGVRGYMPKWFIFVIGALLDPSQPTYTVGIVSADFFWSLQSLRVYQICFFTYLYPDQTLLPGYGNRTAPCSPMSLYVEIFL